MDDKAFNEFLEQADKVVRSWPLWKQTLLGSTGKREEPREPVDNFKQELSVGKDCAETEALLRYGNKTLKEENEALRRETEALRTLLQGHDDRLLRMVEVEARNRELVSDNKDLRQRLKERMEAESPLVKQNEELKKENAELQDRVKSWIKAHDGVCIKLQAFEDSYKALSDRLWATEDTLAEYKKKLLDGSYVEREASRKRTEELHADLVKVVRERDEGRQRNTDLERQLRESGSRNVALWHKLEAIRKAVEGPVPE